jgi:hypothetical protein
MLRYLLLAFFIALWALPSCKRADGDPPKADTLVFIMAGQSNMAGRGTVTAIDPVTHPRVLEIDDIGRIYRKREPNTIFQGAIAGVDCGLSFGKELVPHLGPNTCILLVQCSVSSTGIQDWLGDSVRAVPLYTNLISRTRMAMEHGPLKGILWHQGEHNALSQSAAAGYTQALSAFIARYRNDLKLPGFPFYIGLLPAWSNRPYTQAVNNDILTTAATLPAIHIIATSDLSAKPDSLHFESPGQREFGKRLAQAVLANL